VRGAGVREADPAATRRLQLTLVLLVAIVLALGVAQRHSDLWPLVTWPVYDRLGANVPPSTETDLEVRVRTARGRTYALRAEELVEFSRRAIADDALEGSVEDAEDRTFLARLVDAAVDGDVERIEVWEVTWSVDVTAVRPLDRDHPWRERRLAAFTPEDVHAT
jgi:hypothetical protein